MPSRLREKLFAKRMLCSGALRTGPEDGNHSSGDVDENRIHKIDTAEFSSKFFKIFCNFSYCLFFHIFHPLPFQVLHIVSIHGQKYLNHMETWIPNEGNRVATN